MKKNIDIEFIIRSIVTTYNTYCEFWNESFKNYANTITITIQAKADIWPTLYTGYPTEDCETGNNGREASSTSAGSTTCASAGSTTCASAGSTTCASNKDAWRRCVQSASTVCTEPFGTQFYHQHNGWIY